jgi:TonB family C-terminal domain
MTYRLTLNVLFGVLLCLTGSAMAADATSRSTTVSGGTTSAGFVGDEQVTINRVSAGRFLYPKSAQRRSIEGEVVIEFNVGIDGRVSSAFIVEANPPGRFDSSALRYVNSFVYEPYRLNGTPVEVERISVRIPFRLR